MISHVPQTTDVMLLCINRHICLRGVFTVQELGTPTEKIWPGVSELPAMKKCTFTDYPYNQLRNRFGSLLSDCGFDLLNKYVDFEFLQLFSL